jgi:phosphoglycerol transferase MdoB-like AlkP superfamily enzyme
LDNSNDRARVDQTLFLFRHIQQPLFVHVYMMGTHLYMYDDYDTAVKEFDGYMREVTEALEEMGKLDNTILVIYTDHGASNQRNVRTPLIIRFPNGQYAGQINHNTQLLDIAPTVLDYLGIQPPGWMSGVSLLDGEPPATRPIFSAIPNFRANNEKNQLALDQSRIKPPFYQFGIIDMVICSRWYSVDTTRLTWQSGQIQGYPNPCSAQEMPGDDEAQGILLGQMEKDGFDVSALQSALALDQ